MHRLVHNLYGALPTISDLVKEVQDYKDIIKGSSIIGNEALLGNTKAHKFKLYLDSNGCPIMKCKILCKDVDQLSKNGAGYKLWREDSKGHTS